jgi:hypothetical protein
VPRPRRLASRGLLGTDQLGRPACALQPGWTW